MKTTVCDISLSVNSPALFLNESEFTMKVNELLPALYNLQKGIPNLVHLLNAHTDGFAATLTIEGKPYYFTDMFGKSQMFINDNGHVSESISDCILDKSDLNTYFLSQVIRDGYTNTLNTLYNHITRIPPDSVITMDSFGGITQYKSIHYGRLFSLGECQPDPVWIRSIIHSSVDKRIKAYGCNDKSIALPISGGIDSSILFYHLKELGVNFTTYCLSFNADDIEYARLLDPNVTIIEDDSSITQELAEDIMGMPIDLGSLRLQALLCSKIREQIIFTGDCADAYWGGNNRQKIADCCLIDILAGSPYNESLRMRAMERYYNKRLVLPFKDLSLISYALSLSHEYRIDKKALRDAYRGFLPDKIINRPKACLRSNEHVENSRAARHKMIFNFIKRRAHAI